MKSLLFLLHIKSQRGDSEQTGCKRIEISAYPCVQVSDKVSSTESATEEKILLDWFFCSYRAWFYFGEILPGAARYLQDRLPPGCLLTALSGLFFVFMVKTNLFQVCWLKCKNLTKSLFENLKILCWYNGEKHFFWRITGELWKNMCFFSKKTFFSVEKWMNNVIFLFQRGFCMKLLK